MSNRAPAHLNGHPASGIQAPVQSGSARPAFIVCVAVAVLTILDLVKVNVILTPIENSLGASTTQTQLIVAGYVLAFGISLVPAGRLGDQWNRKAMFLIGLALFTLASLGGALAPTSTVLVVARLLQGFAAGILMPQTLGMIQNLFQEQARGQALGIFGAAIGLGTAVGPTLGGFFVGSLGDDMGWRWTFGMNIPLAIIIIPLAVWLLPSQQRHEAGHKDLDLIGVALMASTVLLTMLPFVLTTGTSSDHPQRWYLLILAAVSGAVFWWWERRYRAHGRSPVLDVTLFRFPSYRNGVIITTIWFAAMPATFLIMTLYNQQGLGHSALVVGMITIPYAIVSAAAAWIAGKYTFQHATTLVILGAGVYLAVLIGLAVIGHIAPAEDTPLLMAITLAAGGLGPGLVMAANQMRTLQDVPLEQAGVGGSFHQVGQRLGNAVGIAVAVSVFYAVVANPITGSAGAGTAARLAAYRGAFELALGVLVVLNIVVLFMGVIDHRTNKKLLAENSM